jgi:CBS domain-containing protein
VGFSLSGCLSLLLKVEDVMVESVITVDADSSVMDAVKVMNSHEIGCLVVTRRGRAVGIVTERDLLNRVIVKSRNARRTLVREIMTKPLIAGRPDMDLEDATKMMFDRKIKKLPVVESGKLLGLITLTDVARFQPQMIKILKKLSHQVSAPRRMEKVVNYYVC